ncbi:unnamed protein product [Somion occarium]|uniref:Piwi domain-containing protein n=1 Tax=Somion occarium TaxID=3059160 RepID=A0ABP1E1B6_9APHY
MTVQISPEIPSKFSRRAREVINQLQTEHASHFTPRAVYDGGAILYSTHRDIPTQVFTVQFSPRLLHQVRFTPVKQVDPNALRSAVANKGRIDISVVTLLQLIVRQAPSIRHVNAVRARSFYSNKGERDIGGGLVAWHGFFQSIRPTMNKIVINIDTTTAPMYKPGPLIQVAVEFLTDGGNTQPKNIRYLEALTPDSVDWRKLERFLKGVRITTTLPSASKWKRGTGKSIKGLVSQAGLYEFNKDGRPMTVQQYLREQYNTRTNYPRMFGIKLNKDAVIPAEYCEILLGQFFKKNLVESQRTAMVKMSTRKPIDRLNTIQGAVAGQDQLFDYASSDFMQAVGMQVSTTPITIQGQVIPSPEIQFKKGTPSLRIREGKWNVRGDIQLALPGRIFSWAVIYFDQNASRPVLEGFITKLHGNLLQRGIAINPAYVPGPNFPIQIGNPHQVSQSLESLLAQASSSDKNSGRSIPPTIIVVILPSSAAQIKKQVKYWGTVTKSVATQCVKAGKYEKANDQYLNNVALKINAKIGGVNCYVPLTEKLLTKTIVVGCDVSHPAPSVDNRPSIASLVASVDDKATVYTAQIQVQEPHVEIIQNLRDMVWEAIKDYGQKYNFKQTLDHLIVFRDGVSEGEYDQVSQQEIGQIEVALKRLAAEAKMPQLPKLTFIIVTKRHHVRFFPQSPQGADSSGNCLPGLVVDKELNQGRDFYLQSHSGIIGTSRPSHYIVLRNDMNWSIQQIQELSYYLCHVYASATRAVSFPAPVYYADLVCAKAEYHIDPSQCDQLDNASTAVSGGEFPLKEWQRAVRPSGIRRSLYFL